MGSWLEIIDLYFKEMLSQLRTLEDDCRSEYGPKLKDILKKTVHWIIIPLLCALSSNYDELDLMYLKFFADYLDFKKTPWIIQSTPKIVFTFAHNIYDKYQMKLQTKILSNIGLPAIRFTSQDYLILFRGKLWYPYVRFTYELQNTKFTYGIDSVNVYEITSYAIISLLIVWVFHRLNRQVALRISWTAITVVFALYVSSKFYLEHQSGFLTPVREQIAYMAAKLEIKILYLILWIDSILAQTVGDLLILFYGQLLASFKNIGWAMYFGMILFSSFKSTSRLRYVIFTIAAYHILEMLMQLGTNAPIDSSTIWEQVTSEIEAVKNFYFTHHTPKNLGEQKENF